jgi:hypothetical protein
LIELGTPIGKGEGFADIDPEDRYKGTYILGPRRSGKTTFMLNMIKRELEHGHIILDPHGELALAVAGLTPPDRLIYVDKHNPLCLNPLDRPYSWDEVYKELIEIINAATIAMRSNVLITWQMEEYYQNAIRVIRPRDLNLKFLTDFLNFERVRSRCLNGTDAYWNMIDEKNARGGYVNHKKRETITNASTRLTSFYAGYMANFTIGANQLDIPDIVASKKIVVFNFQGMMEQDKAFLGNIISHAVRSYSYHNTPTEPLFFYMDEVHLFVTQFFNAFLTECPKRLISFNVSHHNHSQIKPEVLDMLLSGCFLHVVFKSAHTEAKRMATEHRTTIDTFMDLKKYEAYSFKDGEPHKILTFPPPEVPDFIPPVPAPATVNFLKDVTFSI